MDCIRAIAEFIHGFSECWWPGRACKVDWDAWAAIGTGFAAAIALGIGVAPLLLRRRQAKALAMIVVVKLEQQLLRVGASLEVANRQRRTNNDFNVAKINLEHCDPASLREMVPYFDVISDEARKALASCIVDTETVLSLTKGSSYRKPTDDPPGPDMRGILKGLKTSTEVARHFLARFADGKVANIEKQIEMVGQQLLAVSTTAELGEPYGEKWMRERILGPEG